MPNRKADLTVRSGRIKNLEPNQIVIQTVKRAQYRFFNTGKKTFTVKVLSTAVTAVVARQCSVDLLLPPNAKVTIEGTPLDKVEGVYDLVAKGTQIRSGRFKGREPNSHPVTIVSGKPGDVYRLYNIGDRNFTVNSETVPPNCATDVVLVATPISVTREDDQPIAGVYDNLESGAGGRSGHFKLDTDPDPMTFPELKHVLIDATTANRTFRYRITNTGEEPFSVIGDAQPFVLKPDQSLDVAVGDAATIKKIEVTRPDKNTLISGVYDFLGVE